MQVSWLRNYQWVGGGVHTTTWVKRKAGRRTIPAPRGSPAPQPTWGIIVRKRLFPTTKRIWKHFWCLTARQGQLCLTLWTLTVLSGTKANECCSVAAVQLLEVTDGQFGFLQLDFDQVAFIAPQLQEDNSTTMQRKWKHCESLNENQGWEPGAREPKASPPPALILGTAAGFDPSDQIICKFTSSSFSSCASHDVRCSISKLSPWENYHRPQMRKAAQNIHPRGAASLANMFGSPIYPLLEKYQVEEFI